MSEETHDEHAVAGWEGEGGHHGERPLLHDERPSVPTLEEVRAAGYEPEGVAESIVARQEQLLKVWLEQHPETGDDSPAHAGAALETPEAEPLTMAAGSSEPQPKVWTLDEVREEFFPGATRFSGGTAAGLERELRRRNRLATKGY